MTLNAVTIVTRRLKKKVGELEEQINALEQDIEMRMEKLSTTVETQLDQINERLHHKSRIQRKLAQAIVESGEDLSNYVEGALREQARKFEKQIVQLEKDHRKQNEKAAVKKVEEAKYEGLEKAKTLAIFDSILFAISNWSNDGQTASDVELASQAILFPIIYERVMKGEEDYLVETVPVAADEIVKRGREMVRHIRMTTEASLLTPEVWKELSPLIHQWWIADALPLLYGARAEEWDNDQAYQLSAMKAWREEPASRALDFPLLFDGRELVRQFGDQIRENTGLPEFNKRIVETRLNP